MQLFTASLKKFRDAARASTHTHPVRDWFIVLGVAAVLLGCSVGWNVWMYMKTQAEAVLDGAPGKPTFDTKAVDAVRTTFESRADEARKYESEYRFVDPSR